MEPQNSENIGLLSGPRYNFTSSIHRERKKRLRQFQCCLCVTLITAFVILSVALVAYNIRIDSNNDDSPVNNTEILIKSPLTSFLQIPTYLNDSQWKGALDEGKMWFMEDAAVKRDLPPLQINSPSYKHQKTFSSSAKALKLSSTGYVNEFASKYTRSKYKHLKGLICNEEARSMCEMLVVCNKNKKYRSYDGSCNNLKFPFGVAFRPFRRILPPDYADGISAPRKSKNGSDLPSARKISLMVHRPIYKDDPKFTVMLAVWGQFLDHDITATAPSRQQDGATISCCTIRVPSHPECYTVTVDVEDPFFDYNITCLEFVRSAPADTCCFGPREQMNQVSSFIDGSVVYGADAKTVQQLRSFKNGSLKMLVTEDGRELLPVSTDMTDGCNREEERKKGRYCFVTGDGRANENLHLTSMHLIWARHHNSIAKNLSILNPQWDDERLFQESRRILAAQMQHITYNEVLPILLGREIMERFQLLPGESGSTFRGYDETLDASVANSFATAAFRFAHSLIPGVMKLLANDTTNPEYVQLHTLLLDPFKLYQNGEIDRVLRGAMQTPIQASDPYFTNELKNHLFEGSTLNKTCGLDLVSLNIQRGRDHGLPGYTKWMELCGLKKAQNFTDLVQYMHLEAVNDIGSIYSHVDDVDLYTGALSETPVDGGILGPTLRCLILDQFLRLKRGDRFWYENQQIFTARQLNEIRKTRLARIICDNSDGVYNVQKNVMQTSARADNQILPCTNIDSPDLIQWKAGDLRVPVLEAGAVSVTAVDDDDDASS